jgi:hypothetical protein
VGPLPIETKCPDPPASLFPPRAPLFPRAGSPSVSPRLRGQIRRDTLGGTTSPVPPPVPVVDRVCPTRVESRPGPVLARHTSEGQFLRAFLDGTTCPVPVPPPSFPLVRPLRARRADLRVPSRCWSHRQSFARSMPAGLPGPFPSIEKKSPPRRGSFPTRAGRSRTLSSHDGCQPARNPRLSRPEGAMAPLRRTVHSSSARRAEESSRKESLCPSCHRRPIRPRSVFYVSAPWPNAVSVGFREIRVPGSRVKIGARWKSHSVVDRTSVPAGALKARSGELCSRECGSVHSGFPKRCTPEISTRKVGTLYIRPVETNAPKVGVCGNRRRTTTPHRARRRPAPRHESMRRPRSQRRQSIARQPRIASAVPRQWLAAYSSTATAMACRFPCRNCTPAGISAECGVRAP